MTALFDDVDELLQLAPRALSRASDMDTSHLAASSISREALEASELFVLETLRDFHYPLTDEQIAKWDAQGRWSPSRLRTARKQLVVEGLVSCADQEGRTITGRRAARWTLTSRMGTAA